MAALSSRSRYTRAPYPHKACGSGQIIALMTLTACMHKNSIVRSIVRG